MDSCGVHLALVRLDIASASKTLPPKVNFNCQSLCKVTMALSGHTMILKTLPYIHDDISLQTRGGWLPQGNLIGNLLLGLSKVT